MEIMEKKHIPMPTAREVSFGMGEMLGQIHWTGGYDARDIEFVMGGTGLSGITLYCIDFNSDENLEQDDG